MIDFTSSLYLDMKHESSALLKWEQLTTGVPAALYETILNRQIGNRIAQMQGLERGVLAPSTLHLYWDLYGLLSYKSITVFIDEKVYPVSKYGIERLMVNKTPIYKFNHQNINHLAELVNQKLPQKSTPIIITDGWCTGCGKASPIKDYIKLVSPLNGKVIIDDTQAFGILGERKQHGTYGENGCGILRWLSVDDPCIVTIISLAKGFGVPAAIISGRQNFIKEFVANSETRAYSSPVSTAHVRAAINALNINNTSGEDRRNRLLRNVLLLKKEMSKLGIQLIGRSFPVQLIANLDADVSVRLYKKLLEDKIQTVLVSGHQNFNPTFCIIVRSDHTIQHIGALLSSVKNFVLSSFSQKNHLSCSRRG